MRKVFAQACICAEPYLWAHLESAWAMGESYTHWGIPLLVDTTIYALSNHLKYAKSFRNQTKANVLEPISSNIQIGLSHLHNFHGNSTLPFTGANKL